MLIPQGVKHLVLQDYNQLKLVIPTSVTHLNLKHYNVPGFIIPEQVTTVKLHDYNHDLSLAYSVTDLQLNNMISALHIPASVESIIIRGNVVLPTFHNF